MSNNNFEKHKQEIYEVMQEAIRKSKKNKEHKQMLSKYAFLFKDAPSQETFDLFFNALAIRSPDALDSLNSKILKNKNLSKISKSYKNIEVNLGGLMKKYEINFTLKPFTDFKSADELYNTLDENAKRLAEEKRLAEQAKRKELLKKIAELAADQAKRLAEKRMIHEELGSMGKEDVRSREVEDAEKYTRIHEEYKKIAEENREASNKLSQSHSQPLIQSSEQESRFNMEAKKVTNNITAIPEDYMQLTEYQYSRILSAMDAVIEELGESKLKDSKDDKLRFLKVQRSLFANTSLLGYFERNTQEYQSLRAFAEIASLHRRYADFQSFFKRPTHSLTVFKQQLLENEIELDALLNPPSLTIQFKKK